MIKRGLVILLLVFAANYASAQTQQQAPQEMVSVPKNMLTAEQLQQVEMANLARRVETYGKWVGIGKEVGEAVDGALGAVTHRAEELSQTNVGKFTMFVVAWKVLGTDAIQFFMGLLIFLVGMPVIIWSYRKNCIPRPILSQVDANKQKIYKTFTPEKDTQITHMIVFFVFLILCAVVTFA